MLGGRSGSDGELGEIGSGMELVCRSARLRFTVMSVEAQDAEAARVENVGLARQLRHEPAQQVFELVRSLERQFVLRHSARCVIGNRVPAVCGFGRAVDCDQAVAEKLCRAGERGAECCVHEVLPGKVNLTLV